MSEIPSAQVVAARPVDTPDYVYPHKASTPTHNVIYHGMRLRDHYVIEIAKAVIGKQGGYAFDPKYIAATTHAIVDELMKERK